MDFSRQLPDSQEPDNTTFSWHPVPNVLAIE